MRGAIAWLVLIVAMIVAIAGATEILKVSVGGTPGLTDGTVVKVSGDNAIAVCNAGDQPAGVIIGYEDDGGSRYYLIVSSGIAENVLLGGDVTAGDKLTPADGGAVQRLSEYPTGHVVGIALEDGASGERIKIMLNLELDAFGDHPDVLLTDLAVSDLIGWDGTNWVNFSSSYFAPFSHAHTVNDDFSSDISGCGPVDGTWNLQVKYGTIGNAEIDDGTVFSDIRVHVQAFLILRMGIKY